MKGLEKIYNNELKEHKNRRTALQRSSKNLNEALIPRLAKLMRETAFWHKFCLNFKITSDCSVAIGWTKFYIYKGIDKSKPIHISNFYKFEIPDSTLLDFSREVLKNIETLEREKEDFEKILNFQKPGRTLLTERFFAGSFLSKLKDL